MDAFHQLCRWCCPYIQSKPLVSENLRRGSIKRNWKKEGGCILSVECIVKRPLIMTGGSSGDAEVSWRSSMWDGATVGVLTKTEHLLFIPLPVGPHTSDPFPFLPPTLSLVGTALFDLLHNKPIKIWAKKKKKGFPDMLSETTFTVKRQRGALWIFRKSRRKLLTNGSIQSFDTNWCVEHCPGPEHRVSVSALNNF